MKLTFIALIVPNVASVFHIICPTFYAFSFSFLVKSFFVRTGILGVVRQMIHGTCCWLLLKGNDEGTIIQL